MATNLAIDPRLIERALEVSGERTLQEYVARHEQGRLAELFGSLEWDANYDYKTERSRD
jgi:hypothetical protein